MPYSTVWLVGLTTPSPASRIKVLSSPLYLAYNSVTPNVPLKNVRDNLNKIVNYPLEQKFKEIFSEFTVKDENGVVLLTLDTISKAKIESEYEGDIINIILDESLYKEGE